MEITSIITKIILNPKIVSLLNQRIENRISRKNIQKIIARLNYSKIVSLHKTTNSIKMIGNRCRNIARIDGEKLILKTDKSQPRSIPILDDI